MSTVTMWFSAIYHLVWEHLPIAVAFFYSFYPLLLRTFDLSKLLNHVTSSITIRSDHELYLPIVQFLRREYKTNRLMVVRLPGSESILDQGTETVLGKKVIHFTMQKTSLEYMHAPGRHSFMYRGKRFWLDHHSDWAGAEAKGTLIISCYSLSSKLIENFLSHATEDFRVRHNDQTELRSPNTQGPRLLNQHWKKLVTPKKPFDSICMDEEMMNCILDMFNNFYESQQWYYDRGIPYRLGLLFHGPPGTGKSSFVLVLAGLYGLPLCKIPLTDSEPNDVKILFENLPPRCIVLLEDIDCAGIKRKSSRRQKLSFATLLGLVDSKHSLLLVLT